MSAPTVIGAFPRSAKSTPAPDSTSSTNARSARCVASAALHGSRRVHPATAIVETGVDPKLPRA